MRIFSLSDSCKNYRSGQLRRRAIAVLTAWAAVAALSGAACRAGAQTPNQGPALVLERSHGTIVLEPYAPNILRITMSTEKAAAASVPGYGFVAKPAAEGWTHERDADGSDVYRSARMVVRVAPGDRPKDQLPQAMPLDALNQELRERYFGGGGAGAVRITTHSGDDG